MARRLENLNIENVLKMHKPLRRNKNSRNFQNMLFHSSALTSRSIEKIITPE